MKLNRLKNTRSNCKTENVWCAFYNRYEKKMEKQQRKEKQQKVVYRRQIAPLQCIKCSLFVWKPARILGLLQTDRQSVDNCTCPPRENAEILTFLTFQKDFINTVTVSCCTKFYSCPTERQHVYSLELNFKNVIASRGEASSIAQLHFLFYLLQDTQWNKYPLFFFFHTFYCHEIFNVYFC